MSEISFFFQIHMYIGANLANVITVNQENIALVPLVELIILTTLIWQMDV